MTDVLLIAKKRRDGLADEIARLDEFILTAEALIEWKRRNELDGSSAQIAISAAAEPAPTPAETELLEETQGIDPDDGGTARSDPDEDDEDEDDEELVLHEPKAGNARESSGKAAGERLSAEGPDGPSRSPVSQALRLAARAGLDETACSRLERKDVAAIHDLARRLAYRADRIGAALPLDDRATSRIRRRDLAALGAWLVELTDDLADRFGEFFGSTLQYDEAGTSWIAGAARSVRGRVLEMMTRDPAEDRLALPVLAYGAEWRASRVDLHIGRRLRQLRWMRGQSQQEIGASAGLGLDDIQSFEAGAHQIAVSSLSDLAASMGVPVSYFFEGLEGQETRGSEARGDVLSDAEARELVRAYYAIPEGQRSRLFDLARILKEAA